MARTLGPQARLGRAALLVFLLTTTGAPGAPAAPAQGPSAAPAAPARPRAQLPPRPDQAVYWRETGDGGWQRFVLEGGRVVAVTRVEAPRAADACAPPPPPVGESVALGLEAGVQDGELSVYMAPEGSVYHVSRRCPAGRRIDPRRRTWFGTEEAAQGAGRERCQFCERRAGDPPAATVQ